MRFSSPFGLLRGESLGGEEEGEGAFEPAENWDMKERTVRVECQRSPEGYAIIGYEQVGPGQCMHERCDSFGRGWMFVGRSLLIFRGEGFQ